MGNQATYHHQPAHRSHPTIEDSNTSFLKLRLTIWKAKKSDEEFTQLSKVTFWDQNNQLLDIASVDNVDGSSPYGEEAKNLISDNLNFKWLDTQFRHNGKSVLVFYLRRMNTGGVGKYDFCTANDYRSRDPADWDLEIYGSDERWRCVDTREQVLPPDERGYSYGGFVPGCNQVNVQEEPSSSSKLPITKLKLTILEILDPTTSMTQLSMVTFWDGYGNEVKIRIIENPNGQSPHHEMPRNLIDSSTYTKWLDLDFGKNRQNSVLIFYLHHSIDGISKYEFFTANDSPGRDPIKWKLEAFNQENEWILIDSRSCNSPKSRYASYGQFTVGEKSAQDEKNAESDNFVMKEYREMLRLFEDPVLPEYKDCFEEIFLHHNVMKHSRIFSILQYLEERLQQEPLKDSTEDIGLSIIAKAYNTTSSRSKSQICLISGKYIFHMFTRYVEGLGWREKYFAAALRELAKIEDSSGLVSVLSLIAQYGDQCTARRLMLFNTLLLRISPPEPKLELEAFKNDQVGMDLAIKMRSWVLAYVEDHKWRAFQSALLVPAEISYHRLGQIILRDDVQVHGSNCYAAMLESTLKIRLPFIPYYRDEAKAFLQFLRYEPLFPAFQECQLPEKFGAGWQLLKSSRASVRVYSTKPSSPIFNQMTAMDVAELCITQASKFSSDVVPYLKRYTYYFKEEFFLEKIVIKMIGNEGIPNLLNQFLKQCSVLNLIHDLQDGESASDWLYKYDENEIPRLVIDRAKQLLSLLNILK